MKFPSIGILFWGIDVSRYLTLVDRSVPPAKLIFTKRFRCRYDIGYHPNAILIQYLYPQVGRMVGVVGLSIPSPAISAFLCRSHRIDQRIFQAYRSARPRAFSVRRFVCLIPRRFSALFPLPSYVTIALLRWLPKMQGHHRLQVITY